MGEDRTWLIVHEEPLAGYTLINILRVLWDNKFRIHPKYWLRFLYAISLATFIAPMTVIQKLRFHRKIKKTEIKEDPIFIIGHYRTGTTYLMTLMAYDKTKGYVSNIEGYAATMYLAFPRFTNWIMEKSVFFLYKQLVETFKIEIRTNLNMWTELSQKVCRHE